MKKVCFLSSLLTFFFTACAALPEADARTTDGPAIISANLDYPDGTLVTASLAAQIFGQKVSYFCNGDTRLTVSGQKLRFEYPQNQIVHDSGAEIRLDIPSAQHYSFQYTVAFDSAFDFSKGGKLPGLAGGTGTSGGTKCTGDGWSAKLMWRENGALKLYLYHMDMPENYGQYYDLGFTAPKGQPIAIREELWMNTSSNHDGAIDIFINEEKRLTLTGLQFMTEAFTPRIDKILFFSFFGGSDTTWAPGSTVYSYFNKITLK